MMTSKRLALAALVAVAPASVVQAQTTDDGTFGECFVDGDELRTAVDKYFDDPSPGTDVATKYGWPIGNWCVDQVEDFSHVFSNARNDAAQGFNEDLTNWCTCSATDMSYMFGKFVVYGACVCL